MMKRIIELVAVLTAWLIFGVVPVSAKDIGELDNSTNYLKTTKIKADNSRWYDSSWSGELSVMGMKLPLNFNFSVDADGNVVCRLDSPKQNAFGIPCSSVKVSRDANNAIGDTLEVSISSIRASYHGVVRGDSLIEGVFSQGAEFPLELHRSNQSNDSKKERVQTPKAPFPYREKEVRIPNTIDGVTLAGTLTLPSVGSQFPAVVLVSGSGPQNRNEEIFGHKPFAVIADYLTRNGIAVLRYDDRGTAKSTGDFKSAVTKDFARDAETAFTFLMSQPEIDGKKVGYVGHSEGGQIAIMNAARNKRTAFIVTLAAPAIKGRDLMIRQNEMLFAAQGGDEIPSIEKNKIVKIFDAIDKCDNSSSLKNELVDIMTGGKGVDSVPDASKREILRQADAMASRWYIDFIKYDPTTDLHAVKCPVYALGGSYDVQVEASTNLAAIRAQCGSKCVETNLYPDLNHLFQQCQSGKDGMRYDKIDETISARVLEDITKWIKATVKK